MGLDVYLYRYTQHDARHAAEQAREAAHEAIWNAGGEYDKLSEDQQDAIREQCKVHDEANPLPGSQERVELDSALHPGHMFKIGYLRSSYNDGGLDNILRTMLDTDLSTMFGVSREDYHVKPDWQKALAACKEARDRFAAHVSENGFVRIMVAEHNPYISKSALPQSERDALAVYSKTAAEKRKGSFGFDCFSNGEGTFALGGEPMQIRGIIPGVGRFGRREPVIYLAYESDPTFYRQALDVTVEMCEWVLAQPQDPAVEYVLHWSG